MADKRASIGVLSMSPRSVRIPRLLDKQHRAERLRRLRVAAGKLHKPDRTHYSTTEFAKKLGVSQPAYSHCETRNTMPSPQVLAALRDQFDVTADWVILGDDDNMPHFLLEALDAVTDEELRATMKVRD